MLGRKTVLVASLAGIAACSGGVAVASNHGSSHTLQPPKLLPMKQQATNWHVTHRYCHKDGAISASL